MARQILTFVIVFIGLLLIMRSCTDDENSKPTAIFTEKAAPAAGADTLKLGDVIVRLTPNGAIHSIYDGPRAIVRPVSTGRLPFSFLLRREKGSVRSLAKDGWQSREVAGGRQYSWSEEGDEFTATKTFKLVPGGIDVELDISPYDQTVRGYVVSGISGVPLAKAGEETRTLALWKFKGGTLRTFSFEDLVDKRKNRLTRPGEPAVREKVGDSTIERLGIVGKDYYVGFDGLDDVVRLNLDAFVCDREDGGTNEIEAYFDYDAPEKGYKGTLRLRWQPRSEMPDELTRAVKVEKATQFTLENETFKAVFISRGGALLRMWNKKFTTEAGAEPTPDNWIPIIGGSTRIGERTLTLAMIGDRYGADLARADWEGTVEGEALVFRYQSPTKWSFTKRVTLPEEGRYDLGVEITVEPPAGTTAADVKFKLVGPSNGYIADAVGSRFTVPAAFLDERSGGDDDEQTFDDLKDGESLRRTYGDGDRGLPRAICARGSYFLTALITEEKKDADGRPTGVVLETAARAIELTEPYRGADGESESKAILTSMSCRVPVEGGVASARFALYAGPTATEDLREVGLEDAIDFGFFGFIGRILMWLMKFLYGFLGSYGLAIMLMTLIVRALLMPISYKTQVNMQAYQRRMKTVKPLLDAVQAKYAKDPQKMNAERMKVMREHKVGLPLGCLMIFFQIPIWFALFQALRVEFALRHQPFLWAADLAAPDHLFALPFWPHWFNLLPILMLVLWTLQQKLSPTAQSDDPQMKMQMKMMKLMPFVFSIFLYNYAAALAVYMCVSSAWGIAEAKYVRKAIAKTAE